MGPYFVWVLSCLRVAEVNRGVEQLRSWREAGPLPWREAGPLSHLDEVYSGQQVVDG